MIFIYCWLSLYTTYLYKHLLNLHTFKIQTKTYDSRFDFGVDVTGFPGFMEVISTDESKLMTMSLPEQTEADALSLKLRTTGVESESLVIVSPSEAENSDSD